MIWERFMAKITTAQLESIDIRKIKLNEGLGNLRVSKGDFLQIIQLTTTACNYGKSRYWLVCPECEQRAAILYLQKRFNCRKCLKLAYPIENMTKINRAHWMAWKLKPRINWDKKISAKKPKGMHWKTMLKIIHRHNKYDDFAMRGSLRLMEMFLGRLDSWKAKREKRKNR